MKWNWLGGILLIAGILWASLRAGDWMGARVVEQARLEPAEYVAVPEIHHQPRLARRVRITRNPINGAPVSGTTVNGTTVTTVRITPVPVTPLPTAVPVTPAPLPTVPVQMPPAEDAEQVRALYADWKKAHGGSVRQLMRHYAPNVRIVREANSVQSYQQMKQLAAQVRAIKTFNSVRDMTPLRMGGTRRKIVMQAQHRYGHSNSNYTPLSGTRYLIWKNIKGRWLIVEDIFPQSYIVVK